MYSSSRPGTEASKSATAADTASGRQFGGPHQLLGSLQALIETRSQRPGLRIQPPVARRHGQPIGLAHRGKSDQFQIKRQVADELAHNGYLLEVFLPKVRPMGAAQVKQLTYYRGHAVEMPRPVFPFHHSLQGPKINLHYRRARIHFCHFGQKQHGAAGRRQQSSVGLRQARIQAKVVGVVELGGVYENAGHHYIALAGGGAHQLQMPLVQGAHSGH